jgi:hypothetical protein
MALISFSDYRKKIEESSPTTRLRNGIMMGAYPMTAAGMSRSTPSPAFVQKAIDTFGTPEHPNKKKRRKKKHKKKQD